MYRISVDTGYNVVIDGTYWLTYGSYGFGWSQYLPTAVTFTCHKDAYRTLMFLGHHMASGQTVRLRSANGHTEFSTVTFGYSIKGMMKVLAEKLGW